MIKKETRTRIKGYLEGFIQGMISEHKTPKLKPSELRPTKILSSAGDIKPFHEALLPDGIMRIAEFERSFSTKLGTTFEECARLIALDRHRDAQRGYRITGGIPSSAIRTIENIVNGIGSGGLSKSYLSIIKKVLAADNGKLIQRQRIADLYFMDYDGNEYFFEMKSPKPNKGQCLEAADRLLQIHAIKKKGPPRVQTYYAMAYNPYGSKKKDYKHSFALQYMDLKNEVLIGKEFWDLVGGSGVYEEVLDVYREVGREKGPDMIDQLALDY